MKEYKSTSRLLSNYNPMSTIKRKELIAQLEQDMKNHPISERRFKEEKCKDIGVDLRTYDKWIKGENIGLKSLSRIEIGLSESYKACSLIYIEDPVSMRNFISDMTHYIIEASWLNDLDESNKSKIEDSLNYLTDLIEDMHKNKPKELMDVISKITDGKNEIQSFLDNSKKNGVTFFATYIPRYMYPDNLGLAESSLIGLICINVIPIEKLRTRATVQPNDLIIEPRWDGIKEVS